MVHLLPCNILHTNVPLGVHPTIHLDYVEGHCICVSTADCVPIVLYDRKKAAVGVVHAGCTHHNLMRTTIDIPDELFRAAKAKAAR